MSGAGDPGFALYVHWPFCAAKCPYCDFNSHVRDAVDQADWAAALVADIRRQAAAIGPRRLRSIFFGGGTPSLMEPATVSAVIDAAVDLWAPEPDMEVSLEANPTSVEAGRFAGYRNAGVNRVSMGVQALNDADLRRLGRLHSVAEAQAAFDVARSTFDRVSFDLIYARQGQSVADWERELAQALSLAVDHLSLYQLTIEPGTAFGSLHKAGRLRDLPEDDVASEMFHVTQEITETAGLPMYEISNHARAGAESRHNLVYWRYGEYCGVGPGAHGRVTLDGVLCATAAVTSPEDWLAGAAASLTPVPRTEQAVEYAMMGLRLREGISLSRYRSLAGTGFRPDDLAHLSQSGHVVVEGDRLRITPNGRPVLNAVLRVLLGH